MPQEPFGKRLTAPAVILALVAVAASRGVPALLVALILLPPVSAVLAVTAGWWGGAMVCAGAAAACLLVLPADAWILSLAWCVLCAVIPLVKVRTYVTAVVTAKMTMADLGYFDTAAARRLNR